MSLSSGYHDSYRAGHIIDLIYDSYQVAFISLHQTTIFQIMLPCMATNARAPMTHPENVRHLKHVSPAGDVVSETLGSHGRVLISQAGQDHLRPDRSMFEVDGNRGRGRFGMYTRVVHLGTYFLIIEGHLCLGIIFAVGAESLFGRSKHEARNLLTR